MGAAASLGVSADGAFTARQVKELAGENWDEARFDIECSDVGTVTFKQLSGWAAELKAKEEQQAEEKRAFERMALIELYEKNGGEVWTITNNWCVQGGGVSTWHGVTTNAEGNICQLDFSNQALESLEGFDALAGLGLLEKIDLSNNPALKDLTQLGAASQLKQLVLRDGACTDLTALGNLVNLEVLNLEHCEKVHDLSALASMKELKECSLVGMTRVINIVPLFGLKKLRCLGLPAACTDEWIETMVAVWPKIQNVDLTVCSKLTKISLFAMLQLKELKKLDLHPKCFLIDELNDIWLKILSGFAGNVSDLDLEGTTGITSDKLSAVLRSCKHLELFKEIKVGRSKVDNKVARAYVAARPNLHEADFRSCVNMSTLALLQPVALCLRILDVSAASREAFVYWLYSTVCIGHIVQYAIADSRVCAFRSACSHANQAPKPRPGGGGGGGGYRCPQRAAHSDGSVA
jgi:hypothetical protein